MKPDHLCINHPKEEANTFCNHCRNWICPLCTVEGPEHYYCRKPECIEFSDIEKARLKNICPFCGNSIDFDEPFCGSCGKKLRELTPEEKDVTLVTIANLNNPIEAQIAKAKLESEGIEAFIVDENIASVYSAVVGFNGIRLQTKKADADRAKQFLDESQDQLL